MSVPRSIVFATGNPGKLREVSAVLAEAGVSVRGLGELEGSVAEPEETGHTFTANAVLKARYYARATGQMVLAEDSGLEVDALGGAPGVYSARYAGLTGPREVVDPANNARLIAELAKVEEDQRTARFVCVMALADERCTWAVARGVIEGRIVTEPRGANGFGYDPLFYVAEIGRTTAQLDAAAKNAISHRGRATRMMLELIRRIGR